MGKQVQEETCVILLLGNVWLFWGRDVSGRSVHENSRCGAWILRVAVLCGGCTVVLKDGVASLDVGCDASNRVTRRP